MKATIVENLPLSSIRCRNDLQTFLKERYVDGAKYYLIEYGTMEYKNLASAHASLQKAAKCSGLPFRVRAINNKLYLCRTDL